MGYKLLSMYAVFALVFFFSLLFAFFSQPKYVNGKGYVMSKLGLISFVISFIIPWAVISFTRIGVDYDNYEMIIDRLDWSNLDSQGDSEYGFNFVAMSIKSILGGNVHGTIFFLKTITVAGIYLSIYLMRKQVCVVYSVMFYLLIMYLPSFYILSQCLAASLIMLVMVYHLKGGKRLISIAMLLAIGMIHNSVFIFIPFYLLFAYGEVKRIHIGWLLAVFLIIIVFSESFYRFAQSIEGFHYNNYMRTEAAGTGLLLYAQSALMMWMVYQMYKLDNDLKRRTGLIYFSAAICLFNILGQNFEVITRMEFDFMTVYVLFFPSYLKYHRLLKKGNALYTLIILFMLFNGYRVVTGRIDSPIAMMNYYIPFNPFE